MSKLKRDEYKGVVYVVISKYDGYVSNEGVFSTEAKAKEFIKKWESNLEDYDGEELSIEPWTVQ